MNHRRQNKGLIQTDVPNTVGKVKEAQEAASDEAPEKEEEDSTGRSQRSVGVRRIGCVGQLKKWAGECSSTPH